MRLLQLATSAILCLAHLVHCQAALPATARVTVLRDGGQSVNMVYGLMTDCELTQM